MSRSLFFLSLLFAAAIATTAQSPADGTINGHDYVDLGLSVMWATCNIGADQPEDYGDYYAWGEAETKSEYTKENSATYGKDNFTFHDAAAENWGGTWRMPTRNEFEELIDNCDWTWITVGDHNGYKVTSKKNGKSIFLPAAGYRDGSSSYGARYSGFYLSSSHIASIAFYSVYAFALDFTSYHVDVRHYYDRYCGTTIRPVAE